MAGAIRSDSLLFALMKHNSAPMRVNTQKTANMPQNVGSRNSNEQEMHIDSPSIYKQANFC
jgi:hypothetical protein